MSSQKNNIVPFSKLAEDFGSIKRSAFDGGGEPPHNDGMEARVKALEEAVKNLPTKADMDELRKEMKAEWSEFTNTSKADFAALRADIAKGQADMHKAIADNHRWTHTALMSMISVAVIGILGLLVTIWNAGKPHNAQHQPPAAQAPSSLQPIIINVPASSSGDEKENGRVKEPPPAQQ